MNFLWHLPRNVLIGIIRVYQKTLSPDHSIFVKGFFPHGYCRFYPSCSEYAVLALKKYGVIFGLPRIVWRLLRCHPWAKSKVDMP